MFIIIYKEEKFMALIQCPECGKEISNTIKHCPNCGFNLKHQIFSKSNLIITVIVIIFILALGTFGFVYLKNTNSNQGYYDENKWGTSYDEIKNKYGDDISESYLNSGALAMYKTNFNDVDGIYVMIQFEFDKYDGLDTVLLMISNLSSGMSNSKVYNMIVEGLTESYGEAKEVDYGLSWETKNSIIAAKQYPGSTDATMIMYSRK
jgi:hypothetical protein